MRIGPKSLLLITFFCVRLFNEGFYLHSRITVQIFNSEAPVILFNIIGWGESGHKYSVMSHHSLARNLDET